MKRHLSLRLVWLIVVGTFLSTISLAQLSGTYSIGPSGNYTSVAAAASALNSQGVSGPVVFNVASGTYSGKVTLNAITGTSATNTIQFIGASNTNTIITRGSTSSADRATILFAGADYVTFKNFDIVNTGASYGTVIHFRNSSDYNVVENCKVRFNGVKTSTNFNAILASSSESSYTGYADNGQYNTIKDCDVTYGYYTIRWNGQGSTTPSLGNQFLNNNITQFYYYGMYTYYCGGMLIKDNTISNPYYTYAYGLMHYYGTNSTWDANDIQGGNYGMYIYYENYYNQTGTSYITNNMVHNFKNTSYHYGIMTYYGYNVNIFHNSVRIQPTSTSYAYACCYNYYMYSGLQVKNNIFVNEGSSGGSCVYQYNGTFGTNAYDHNIYISRSSYMSYWNGTQYSDYPSWRMGAMDQNANSENYDPGWVSATNLHLSTTAKFKIAPDVGVAKDFDGDSRGIYTGGSKFCIVGADEISVSGYDIALKSIDSPIVFGVGDNYVTLRIQNKSVDSLMYIDFGYQVDNNTPILIYDHYIDKDKDNVNDTLWLGDEYTYRFATPITLAQPGSHTLKVWATNGNDILPDDDNTNDTIIWHFCTGMSGTYVVGPSANADFADLSTAASAIDQCGIAGPITFELEKGTYSGRVVLNEITGMSATNTITIDGVDKDDVTIEYNGSSAQRATILFDGADYFTLKNLTIKGTNSSYATALHFMNGANYNRVENCNLEVPIASSSYVNVVLGSSSETSYSGTGNNGYFNVIDNCDYSGGYYGIRWNGQGSSSSAKPLYGNKFTNSTFENQYYYVYYTYYTGGNHFSYNDVHHTTSTSGSCVYLYYSAGDTITSNIMRPGQYGIYEYYYNNYGNQSWNTLIANNIIYDFSNPTYQVGIRSYYYGYNQMIYNNTIWVNGTTANNRDYAAIYMYYMYNSEIMNNIFISTGGTLLSSYYYPRSSKIDYNYYHYEDMTGTYPFYGYYNPQNTVGFYSDLQEFIDYNDANYIGTHDLNSWDNEVIHFVSNTDLHLDSRYPAIMGEMVDLWDDVDGDPRCKFETAIGADETGYTTGLPNSMFIVEDTVCFGTPIIFANTASSDAKQGYQWFHNGQRVSTDFGWEYTFAAGEYDDTISLVTENCTGFDTFTKIIHVDTPQAAPQADFIADMNIVETSFPVQFYDISQNCPDNWYWIINPDSIFDPAIGFKMSAVTYLPPTFVTSQNPWISFDYPGSYDVCLVAANIRGVDTICKEDYIVVKPSQWMCQYVLPSVSKSLFGFLFDDGGPFSDYSNSVNCNLLLDPCADQLSIKFTEFDFASGDYLRLYDGMDNTGTPMWDVNAYGTTGLTGNMANAAFDTVFHSQSGKIYIELESNASGQAAGFQAEWFGVKGNFAKPTADFIVNDTVCYNQELAFMDNSIGDNLTYSWDFDMDGFVDATAEDPTWTYNLWGPGQYTVELNVENCGGSSSKKKTIDVIQPNSAPNPDFEADILRPVAGEDNVTFMDMSFPNSANPYGCSDQWAWEITPKTYMNSFGITVPAYDYVMGTDSSSQNPVVRFNDTGYYDVKLVVYYNTAGSQTIKNDYIYAIKYCKPGVTNLNPDLGISHVVLADIDNSSQIGKNAYTDFSNTASTPIDLQGTYTLTVERNTTYNEMNRAVWIDWDVDGEYEASELIGTENNAKTLQWNLNFTVPANAPQGATRMRIATSLGGSPNTDPCANRVYGEVEDYRVIIRPDGTPPEITIIGDEMVYVEQCDCWTYVDSGATAMDNIDGVVSVTTTNNFDCTKDGQYYYRYSLLRIIMVMKQ
jgi:PKD repeat protein